MCPLCPGHAAAPLPPEAARATSFPSLLVMFAIPQTLKMQGIKKYHITHSFLRIYLAYILIDHHLSTVFPVELHFNVY